MAALADCSPSPYNLVADAGHFYLIFEQRLIPSSSAPASPSFLDFDSLSLNSRAHAQRGSMWGILLNRGEARRLMTLLRDLVAVRATSEVPLGAERACLESAKHARRFLSVLASQLPVGQSPSTPNQTRSSLTRNNNSDLFWTVEVDNVDRQHILSLFESLMNQGTEDPSASMYSHRSNSSLGLTSEHVGLAAFGTGLGGSVDGSWVAEHRDSARSGTSPMGSSLYQGRGLGSSPRRGEGGYDRPYPSDRGLGESSTNRNLEVMEHMDGSWVGGHIDSSRQKTPPLGSVHESQHLDHRRRHAPLSTDRAILPPRMEPSHGGDGRPTIYLSDTSRTVGGGRLLPSPALSEHGYLTQSAVGLSRPSWEDELGDSRRPRAMSATGERYPPPSNYAIGSGSSASGRSPRHEAWQQPLMS